MIKAILATDEQGAIGLNNKLPWYCPEDLRYFKKVTDGGCILMGRNTFESFSSPLPNRKHLVISSVPKKSYLSQDIVWFTSLKPVCELEGSFLLPFKNLWVVGGKSIYEQSFEFVNEIHHTVIKGTYEADTYMDMSFLENGDWRLYSKEILSDKATVSIWKRKEEL